MTGGAPFRLRKITVPTLTNILEDFLYLSFMSVEYIAMIRANGIFDILVSRPLR